jgi:hypothetical protein
MNGVTRVLLRGYTTMGIWYWAIILSVMAALAGFGGTFGFNMAHRELWAAVTDAPQKYVISVIGILAVTTHLPIHIANGVSRRGFARSAAVFGAFSALAFSLLTLGGYGMQALILSAWGISDGYPAVSVGDIASTGLGLLLIAAC